MSKTYNLNPKPAAGNGTQPAAGVALNFGPSEKPVLEVFTLAERSLFNGDNPGILSEASEHVMEIKRVLKERGGKAKLTITVDFAMAGDQLAMLPDVKVKMPAIKRMATKAYLTESLALTLRNPKVQKEDFFPTKGEDPDTDPAE